MCEHLLLHARAKLVKLPKLVEEILQLVSWWSNRHVLEMGLLKGPEAVDRTLILGVLRTETSSLNVVSSMVRLELLP